MILSILNIFIYIKYITSTNTLQDDNEIFINNIILDKSDRIHKLFINLSNNTGLRNYNRCINLPEFKKEAWEIIYTSLKEKCTRDLSCSKLIDILSLIDFLGLTDKEEYLLEKEIFLRHIGLLILDNIINKNLILNNQDILSLSYYKDFLEILFKIILNCINNDMMIYSDQNIYDLEYKDIKLVKFIHYLEKESKSNCITDLVICCFGKALNLSKFYYLDIFDNLEVIIFNNTSDLISQILNKYEIEWLYIIGLNIKQEDIDNIIRWQKNIKFIKFENYNCNIDYNMNKLDIDKHIENINSIDNNKNNLNNINNKNNLNNINNTNNTNNTNDNIDNINNYNINNINNNTNDDNINFINLSNFFRINTLKSIILENIKLDSSDFFTLSNTNNIMDISLIKCNLYSSKDNINILDQNEEFIKYINIDYYDSFPNNLEYLKIEDCIINDEFIEFYKNLNIKQLIINKTIIDDKKSNLDNFITKLIDLPTINNLHISGINISEEVIKKIGKMNSLNVLRLINCNLKFEYLREIINLSNIYTIDLSKNIEISEKDINNLWTEINKKNIKLFM